MKIIKCKNYEEASKVAGEIMSEAILLKPDLVLGLATGSSPIGTYKNLIEDFENKKISFKDLTVTMKTEEEVPYADDVKTDDEAQEDEEEEE